TRHARVTPRLPRPVVGSRSRSRDSRRAVDGLSESSKTAGRGWFLLEREVPMAARLPRLRFRPVRRQVRRRAGRAARAAVSLAIALVATAAAALLALGLAAALGPA